MSSSTDQPIIFYHYVGSPYADRVGIYLTIQGIPFIECLQPPVLPRPDLAALGVKYRRIPVLSIGRDVYLDSRLITEKLEGLKPGPAKTPEQAAIERLLRTWTTGPELFFTAAMMLPLDNPMINDPNFQRDRADLVGRDDGFSRETRAAARPESIPKLRSYIAFLEETLLSDGRQWALNGDKPTIADVDAVWILRWLKTLGAFEELGLSQSSFPKVFSWLNRFNDYVDKARKDSGQRLSIKGKEALEKTVGAKYHNPEPTVNEGDAYAKALGLKAGQNVQLWPSDYGSSHKDEGKLLGFTESQITIETTAENGSTVRVHAPRHGFRVKALSATKNKI